MSPLLDKWIRSTTLAVHECLQRGDKDSEIRHKLEVIARRIKAADPKTVRFLVETGMAAARGCRRNPAVLVSTFWQRKLEIAANTADRKLQYRAKRLQIADALEHGDVFYVSTVHQKPADGHKDWQGKLYVDRMWRSNLRSEGMESWIPTVGKWIAEHGIKTVQWAIGAPVYLCTRPYCRHKLIPIPVYEAMSCSRKQLIARHPEILDHSHRSMTRAQAAAKYTKRRQELRRQVKQLATVQSGGVKK